MAVSGIELPSVAVFYQLDPEVAGGLGTNTEMSTDTRSPVVSRLHYEFEGWLGDALLTTFPCFIATRAACQALELLGAL